MRLYEREIHVPVTANTEDLIGHFQRATSEIVSTGEVPVRFVVTRSDNEGYDCEVGVLSDADDWALSPSAGLFDFHRRRAENVDRFNAVLLVPTGIGAEIGGHAGDAGAVARLLAGACDTLITHPNVVNASDINELPENGLYVEGSVICRLLMGSAGLQPVRTNRVILVVDEHPESEITELVVNAASVRDSV